MSTEKKIILLTPDEVDEYVCECGNTSIGSGFYPCDVYGAKCVPDEHWDGFYMCEECGKLSYIARDEDIRRQEVRMRILAGELPSTQQVDSTFYFEEMEKGKRAWKLQDGYLEELLIQQLIKRSENNNGVACNEVGSSILANQIKTDYDYSVEVANGGDMYIVFLGCLI